MFVFVILFLVGLMVGSFLNVVILRLAWGKSPVRGRSHCPQCKHVLEWNDLIPVISFILQRGRCRYCQKSISWQYPLVELATAMAFVALGSSCGVELFAVPFVSTSVILCHPGELLWQLVLACFLILIFVYDARFMQIPDHFTIPAFIVAFLGRLLLGEDLKHLALGILIGAGFFGAQYLLSRGAWIGSGDIRLGAVMGAGLSFPGVLAALFFGYVSGAVVGVVLLATGRATRKTKIPFGTFLSAATFIALIFHTAIEQFFDIL